MRILHLLGDHKLPSNPAEEGASGVVKTALEFARLQVCLGNEVSVAVAGRSSWRSTWNGVQLISLPIVPWARVRIDRRVLDFRRHLPYIMLTRRQRFDIVHGHLYYYMRFLRARGRVVHFHSDPFYPGRSNEKFDLKRADLMQIARYSDAQVTVSQFIVADLKQSFQGSGNLHLVRCGVDAKLFDPKRWQEAGLKLRREWGVPEDGIVFLFAGAIVPEKGVIHLARAFSRLAAQNPKVHLILAGSSKLWGGELSNNRRINQTYEDEVRDELHGLAATGRVHFLGKVPSAAMPAIYVASDTLVIPSVWREAFGLVALEALASGRPVITSSVGGLAEIVNEENGLLVPPGDESVLENAMRRLADSADLRNQLGRTARAHAFGYSWDRAVQQLDTIYQEILAEQA